MPKVAEHFGKVPHIAKRKENHTLTVRETARMFETAGVARTERSVINWCQPNRQGIARLDSYFDPNERKYYITPHSVETVIQEEIQRVGNLTEKADAETFGISVEHVKHSSATNRTETVSERKVQEMEREIIDLKITNRGKDFLIQQLQIERTDFFEKLISANRAMGQLETKLNLLGEQTTNIAGQSVKAT